MTRTYETVAFQSHRLFLHKTRTFDEPTTMQNSGIQRILPCLLYNIPIFMISVAYKKRPTAYVLLAGKILYIFTVSLLGGRTFFRSPCPFSMQYHQNKGYEAQKYLINDSVIDWKFYFCIESMRFQIRKSYRAMMRTHNLFDQ